MRLEGFWHGYIGFRIHALLSWLIKICVFELNSLVFQWFNTGSVVKLSIRFLCQVVLLFFLTIASSCIFALVLINFLSQIFPLEGLIRKFTEGLMLLVYLYVNFFYCFPDQITELRGRYARSRRYPAWVRHFIAGSCALLFEEVVYYFVIDTWGLSEVLCRLLSFSVFFAFYGYFMSGKQFKGGR